MKLLRIALSGTATLRHALLALAVAAAIGLLAVSTAINPQGSTAGGASAAKRLVSVNRINFTRPLPLDYARRIGQLPGVEATTHATWMGLYYPDPKNIVTAFGVDPATYFDVYSYIAAQPWDALSQFRSRRDAVLIGQELAQQLGLTPGMAIRMRSNIYGGGGEGWDFVVAGTFTNKTRDGEADYVLARYDYFDDLRPFNKGTIGRVVFTSKSHDLNDGLARTIDDMFAASPAATITESAASFNKSFASQSAALSNLIRLSGWTALASTLLALHAAILFDVRRHARELALLKIMGFSSWTVAWRTLAPVLAIVVVGAVLGLLLAYAGIALLVRSGIEGYRSLSLSDVALLGPSLVALTLALASAAIPSLIAVRLPALRVFHQHP